MQQARRIKPAIFRDMSPPLRIETQALLKKKAIQMNRSFSNTLQAIPPAVITLQVLRADPSRLPAAAWLIPGRFL